MQTKANDVTFLDFKTYSGRIIELRSEVRNHKQERKYYAYPSNRESLAILQNILSRPSNTEPSSAHNTSAQNQSTDEAVILEAVSVPTPITTTENPNTNSTKVTEQVSKFWSEHYKQSLDKQSIKYRIEPKQVFNLFTTIVSTELSADEFKTVSGKCGINMIGQDKKTQIPSCSYKQTIQSLACQR